MASDSTLHGRRRILVVDDDAPLLEAIERAFSEAGELVSVRGSFEEARQLLKQQAFEVLITDVRLGAFNGLQLAVLARDLNPDTQLIVFSGFDDPVLRHDAEQLGAVYLVKPVTSSYLIQLIHQRDKQGS